MDIGSGEFTLSVRREFFNEPKNVGIYLLRRLREEKLKDIEKWGTSIRKKITIR
jgi:hypothetical protein